MFDAIPKHLLVGILINLYFKEQLKFRCVCRKWNKIIQPQLAQQDIIQPSPKEKRFGKFVRSIACYYEDIGDLYFLNCLCTNVKELSLRSTSKLSHFPLVKQLLEKLSSRGVALELDLYSPEHYCFNGVNFTSLIFGFFHRNIISVLRSISQPDLKELLLYFNIETKQAMCEITKLIERKFDQLEVLNIYIEVYDELTLNVFPRMKSLETMSLNIINDVEGISCAILPAETNVTRLNLNQEAFKAIKNSPVAVRLESVKELHLSISGMNYFGLETIFPNLDSLFFTEEPLFSSFYKPYDVFISDPQNVTKLEFKLRPDSFLLLDFEQVWPTVLSVNLICQDRIAFKGALRWIFTCFPSLQSLALDLPSLEYQHLYHFEFLKKDPPLPSLTKLKSIGYLSLDFIELFLRIAPNLAFLICPLDRESCIALSKLPSIYFEPTPI